MSKKKTQDNKILEYLISMRDEEYAQFQAKLIPTIDPESVIGVRTPILRNYAKELMKSKEEEVVIMREAFLKSVPHKHFDENQLHAFLVSLEKDYDKCIHEVDAFLPYVDNWATCDQMSPKIFKKHLLELDNKIKEWLESDKTYTIRFAIGMRMEHFLEDNFKYEDALCIAAIRSDEYYINMMKAWYFATALAKNYEETLPILLEKKMDIWSHNKTIQKAVESFRITPEQKVYLKTLKIK